MMAGVRQWEPVVLAVALLAGCLDSPPGAVSDADASVSGASDAAPLSCSTIVRNQFTDTDKWQPFAETGATVMVEADQVHITVTAPESGAWGDITAEPTSPLDKTELSASFSVGVGATGTAGISWAAYANDDYYDLVVDGDQLVAVDAPNGDASATVLCDPCPAYDRTDHARIRLHAEDQIVHFQAAPAEGEWVDIATAPLHIAGRFEAVAYGWADAGELSDMVVTEMVWRLCE